MDSDRLYVLDAGELRTGVELGGVFLRAPVALYDALSLLGGEVEEQIVVSSLGKERTLSARRAGRDRIDALDLGEDERFRGRALLSPGRVWVSTNRSLLLFDRTRELYLLDSDSLPEFGGGVGGGDLYGLSEHVLVLGPTGIWAFRAR
jgi:hypothetical protein